MDQIKEAWKLDRDSGHSTWTTWSESGTAHFSIDKEAGSDKFLFEAMVCSGPSSVWVQTIRGVFDSLQEAKRHAEDIVAGRVPPSWAKSGRGSKFTTIFPGFGHAEIQLEAKDKWGLAQDKDRRIVTRVFEDDGSKAGKPILERRSEFFPAAKTEESIEAAKETATAVAREAGQAAANSILLTFTKDVGRRSAVVRESSRELYERIIEQVFGAKAQQSSDREVLFRRRLWRRLEARTSKRRQELGLRGGDAVLPEEEKKAAAAFALATFLDDDQHQEGKLSVNSTSYGVARLTTTEKAAAARIYRQLKNNEEIKP